MVDEMATVLGEFALTNVFNLNAQIFHRDINDISLEYYNIKFLNGVPMFKRCEVLFILCLSYFTSET